MSKDGAPVLTTPALPCNEVRLPEIMILLAS